MDSIDFDKIKDNIDENRGFRCVVIKIIDFLMHILFRLEYHGLDNIPPKGPLLLTANHTSLFDILAIFIRVDPWIYWVGKKEVLKYRIFRQLFYWWGMIPVDRKKIDLHTAKMMLKFLQEDKVIGIFPEGTRIPANADLKNYPPHCGAANFAGRHNIPILPVAIDGRFKLFGKVKIIFGKPYTFDVDKTTLRHNLLPMTYRMMEEIYTLKGQSYPKYRQLPENSTASEIR